MQKNEITLLVATKNAHKVKELSKLIKVDGIEFVPMTQIGFDGEIEENGKSFKENAAIKALAASKYSNAAAFADDSGLEVEALDGRPGIYSSRYAPTDAERIAKLLGELEGKENRRARFVCAISIAFNGEVLETFEGTVEGTITLAPKGDGGFGYDPVFQPDGYDQTFGELPAEVKNSISHRKQFLYFLSFPHLW